MNRLVLCLIVTTAFTACMPPEARAQADDTDVKSDERQQRLDDALAEYEPAVKDALADLTKEIERQLDIAMDKGDIELAKKCREAGKALTESGTPPAGEFLKNARDSTQRKITRAGEKLSAAFDAVAKAFLKDGNLERAEAILNEKAELLAEMKAWKTKKTPAAPKAPAGKAAANEKSGGNSPQAGKQIEIEMVTVGDPGNEPDTNGLGAVDHEFRIGKYEITVAQYARFLNAVAKDDPHKLFDSRMTSDESSECIKRVGEPGNYQYVVLTIQSHGRRDWDGFRMSPHRPITSVNWWCTARFANWMHNGQGSSSTETGAYSLEGLTAGDVVRRNPDARFFLPDENEWYKAAYFDSSAASGPRYWAYGTRSGVAPESRNVLGRQGAQREVLTADVSPNKANYKYSGGSASTLTPSGLFTRSSSACGCYDMSGNVYEWLEDCEVGVADRRFARGGCWFDADPALISSAHKQAFSGEVSREPFLGFRIAAAVGR